MRWYVAEINIEPMFPNQLAGVGVEAHHPLLFLFALARGVLEIEMIADNDGRRPAAVGAFQARLSPVGDHFAGRPFSSEMPSRAGPRHSAQSLARAGTANKTSNRNE